MLRVKDTVGTQQILLNGLGKLDENVSSSRF